MSAIADYKKSQIVASQQRDGYGGPDRRFLPDDAPLHPDAIASQMARDGMRLVTEDRLPPDVTFNGR